MSEQPNKPAQPAPFRQVHPVNQAFYEYTPEGSEHSNIACATDWWNGEGFDLSVTTNGADKIFSVHSDEWAALLKTAKEAKNSEPRIASTTYKTVLGKDLFEETHVESQEFADRKDFTTTIKDKRQTKTINLAWHELDGLRHAIKLLHQEADKRMAEEQRRRAGPVFDPFDL